MAVKVKSSCDQGKVNTDGCLKDETRSLPVDSRMSSLVAKYI